MTIGRKYWRVYSRANWLSAWELRPYLRILSFSQAASPAMGQASLFNRYGKGRWEDGTAVTDGRAIEDFSGHYIRIERCDTVDGSGAVTCFVGFVPSQDFLPEGYSAANDSAKANQIVTALSIDYLLGISKMRGAWVTDDGSTAKLIDTEIEFNNRLQNGRIEGNRSDTIFYAANQAYVFDARGAGRKVWSVWRMLESLFKNHKPATGPQFIFPESYYYQTGARPAIIDALDQFTITYRYRGRSFRDALNELVGRDRGMGWGIRIDNEDRIVIHIWSVLETAVTVGGITIPAHDAADWEDVNLWGIANNEIQIKKEDSAFDKIRVEGAPIKVCGTFDLSLGDLEAGWTAARLTAYKDAAKLSTGYDGKTEDEQKIINDLYRAAEQFEEVFTSYVVPSDWDWTASTAIINPKFDAATCDFVAGRGVSWNGQKRFLAYLPLKEGWSYSGALPVELTPGGSEEKYRKIMALAIHSGGGYVNLEKNPKVNAQVMPMTERFGVSIRFNPSHVMGKNHWTDAEPSSFDDSLDEYGFDYDDLLVTAMLETDQMLAAEIVIRTAENMRELTIQMPAAELWTILPGTVIDVDKNGSQVVYGPTNTILRDDRDVIKAVLAAAAAYYSRARYKIAFVTYDLEWNVMPGKMLTGFNIEGDGTRGGCISSITWDVRAGTMQVCTESAELDFRGLAGAATALASGRHTATRRAGNDYTESRREIRQLREELYTAVKQRPSAFGGAGESGIRLVYCKTDAGADDDIVGYPDEDWNGSGEEPATVTVHCTIAGGGNLNSAFPRLTDGLPIPTWLDGSTRRCLWGFQASDEDCET